MDTAAATSGEASKWIICRICLKHSTHAMYKIFDAEAAQDWPQKIEQCGGVSLDTGADLPDSMCSKCELLLRAAHKFRVLCQRSQEQLVELLRGASAVPQELAAEQHTHDEALEVQTNSREEVEGNGYENMFVVKKEERDSDGEMQNYSDDGGGEYVPCDNVIEEDEDDQQEWIEEEDKVDYNDVDICADMAMEELEEVDEVQEQIDCEYIEIPNDRITFLQDDSSQNLVSDEMSNISYPNEQHYQIVHEIVDEVTNSVNSNDDVVSCESIKSQSPPQSLMKVLPSGAGNKRKRQQPAPPTEIREQAKLNEGAIAVNQMQVVQKFIVTKVLGAPVRKRRVRTKREVATAENMNDGEQMQEEPEPQNYICCHCGNIYYERAKLTLHMKNHQSDKEKPHECEICHKRFAQTPQLARHMNSHTGSRPFKCKFCPASFADPSTCIKHQRIHTNERPYSCPTCGKSFTYSNVLKVHMMTHTGEKPYSCMHCDKKFSQLHHKKTHERSHRDVEHMLRLEEDNLDLQ